MKFNKKTFIDWLRSMPKPSKKDLSKQEKIDMFWSFANNSNGTDNYDIAGLFMTAAERLRVKMRDDT